MFDYKCCECNSRIEWDANCTVDEGIGHYYCTNEKCVTHKIGGTIKINYETKKVYFE